MKVAFNAMLKKGEFNFGKKLPRSRNIINAPNEIKLIGGVINKNCINAYKAICPGMISGKSIEDIERTI